MRFGQSLVRFVKDIIPVSHSGKTAVALTSGMFIAASGLFMTFGGLVLAEFNPGLGMLVAIPAIALFMYGVVLASTGKAFSFANTGLRSHKREAFQKAASRTLTCPKCGRVNSADSNFCSECAMSLEITQVFE